MLDVGMFGSGWTGLDVRGWMRMYGVGCCRVGCGCTVLEVRRWMWIYGVGGTVLDVRRLSCGYGAGGTVLDVRRLSCGYGFDVRCWMYGIGVACAGLVLDVEGSAFVVQQSRKKMAYLGAKRLILD